MDDRELGRGNAGLPIDGGGPGGEDVEGGKEVGGGRGGCGPGGAEAGAGFYQPLEEYG